MTNYEKFKEQIDWQSRVGAKLAVKKNNNTPTMCALIGCTNCAFSQEKEKCIVQAIEWLKEEHIEHKTDIEIGDMVEITDKGCSYTTYSDWVFTHVSNKADMLKYDIKQIPCNGDIGVVRGKAMHEFQHTMLYYIELNTTGRCYLLSQHGIKLHSKEE